MPFLPWLLSIFTGLISFFAEFLTKRFAVLAAILTTFLSIFAAFTLAIQGIIDLIAINLPTGAVLFGLGLLPGNAEQCVSFYITGQIASMLYRFRLEMLDFNSRALLIR